MLCFLFSETNRLLLKIQYHISQRISVGLYLDIYITQHLVSFNSYTFMVWMSVDHCFCDEIFILFMCISLSLNENKSNFNQPQVLVPITVSLPVFPALLTLPLSY